MGTELLFTALFVVLVLGLLAALIFSMVIVFGKARNYGASAEDAAGQKRFLAASILNVFIRPER